MSVTKIIKILFLVALAGAITMLIGESNGNGLWIKCGIWLIVPLLSFYAFLILFNFFRLIIDKKKPSE